VAHLTQQVLQLRAQQLLSAESLTAMRTAKELGDQPDRREDPQSRIHGQRPLQEETMLNQQQHCAQ
jgi:hypothetical protein